MRETTQFANYEVEIWRRPRQRHMHLTVRPDGRVRVTCNKRSPKRDIFAFITESRGFIERRVLELEALRKRFPRKEFVTDETFLFLGQRLPLQVVWTWTERIQVTAGEGELEMKAPVSSSREERAKAMRMFYRRQARLHLAERVQHFARAMGLQPKDVSIRGQSTRWGSYSATGTMSLNMKLMCCPENVIDYVVIHELAHIAHMDHSPRFWSLVGTYFPDYRAAKKWLKEHEPEIAITFGKK